jgi:F0F1-type ATP synthase assembly protein I
MKNKNPFIDESAFEGEDTPTKSEDEVLMEQAKQNTEVKVVKTYMTLGMIIGLAVGAVVGPFLFDKITTGMGLGMLVGFVVGACFHKKDTTNPAEDK